MITVNQRGRLQLLQGVEGLPGWWRRRTVRSFSRQASAVTLLSLAIAGCGRQQEQPPPPPQPSVEAAQSLLSEPEDGRPNPVLNQPEEGPSDSALPLYELRMDPKDMMALQRNPYSNETRPATFVAGAEVYEGVKVRTRGAFSRSWPKKSLKIIFKSDQPFDGHHALDLNSGWRDPAMLREALAYHVYAMCGAPASRSRMVRLNLNGKFRGVYVEVEPAPRRGAAARKTQLPSALRRRSTGAPSPPHTQCTSLTHSPE